jgi:6-phosphogluconolactonase
MPPGDEPDAPSLPMMSPPVIETYATAAAQADAASAGVAAQLREALATRGRATLVATGGRSPGPVYDRLVQAPDLDWARVVVTLSDERCVPPDDPASNARLVRQRLLQGRAARAHLLPLWPQPDPAALAALLPFDAVLLGLGEDGHVASLIPGDPGLAQALAPDNPALTVDAPAGLGSPPVARISLTLAAIAQARAIFLLTAGEAKRAVLARVLAEPGPADAALPVAALIARARVPVRILWSPAHEE